jgi:actin, other eukaryote
VLSLYSTGSYTAIIVECGHEVTQVIPVYSGSVMDLGIEKYDYAGGNVTEFLCKTLNLQDYKEAKKIKEQFCFISEDIKTEKSEEIYKLPDGKELKLGKELFTIPEFLFQPSMIGLETLGLSNTIHRSIQQCEIDTRKEISSNIVLSGGTSRMKGFKQRIHKEVSAMNPKWKLNTSVTENLHSAWLGGSVVVAHQSFNNLWFNKLEYQENGAKHVHTKCF